MLESNKGTKPANDRIKFELTDSMKMLVETDFFPIYSDTRAGKTFKVINGYVVPVEQREVNMWRNRQRNPRGFIVDEVRDATGAISDYSISKNEVVPPATPAANTNPNRIQRTAPAANVNSNRVQPAAPAANVNPNRIQPTAPAANVNPNRVQPAAPAANVNPNRIQPTAPAANVNPNRVQPTAPAANVNPNIVPPKAVPNTTQNQRRSGYSSAKQTKTSTISESEKVSRIAFTEADTYKLLLETEFFKIYNDTRAGRTFKVIDGMMVPLEQREVNMWKNRQRSPQNFMVEIINDASGKVYDYKIERSDEEISPQNVESAKPINPSLNKPAAPAANANPNRVQPTAPAANANPNRVQPTAPAANANPNRVQPAAPAANANPNRVQPAAPAANANPNRVQPAAPAANANPNRVQPAASLNKNPNRVQGAAARARVQKVKETIGTAPTDRIDFIENENTVLIMDSEYCKFYNDKRWGRTIKVIDGKIIPIEQRELNMWKNRVKSPQGFAVEVFKDSTGKIYDCKISKVNEDGTLTPAPEVAPAAPYVPPVSNTPATTDNKAAVSKTPVGDVSTSTLKGEKKDRIKFEENEHTILVLENEFCKFYNDKRAGKTYKIIGGMIVPIQQKELNMWKNRKRTPKNFAVEIVKDETGADYDYIITRTGERESAAVETTSTKTNVQPVADVAGVDTTKRRQNGNRMAKCAVCGKSFKESDMFLVDNRNFCSECISSIVKEKLDAAEADPIKKTIDEVVSADELYCTYSTVTNYPYLDDEFCVNICTIKRAAETGVEDTVVTTIDDRGSFFDDLKRFGLKKIIVNNDRSHVFEPHDFDEHVKTEGVLAPKLYFKILDFMQKKDDDIREDIAALFLGSRVYTYALDTDITEITEENLDEFKPILMTDGYTKFCPVFTDLKEARSVGMPLKGLYELDARLIVEYTDSTHYIINAASLGFIMNKSILGDVEPKYDKDLIAKEEETPAEETKETPVETDVPAEEVTTEEKPVEENLTEKAVPAPAAEVKSEPVVEEKEPVKPVQKKQPGEITINGIKVSAPVYDTEIPEAPHRKSVSEAFVMPTDPIMDKPTPVHTAAPTPAPMPAPAPASVSEPKKMPQKQPSVITINGIKVSAPIVDALPEDEEQPAYSSKMPEHAEQPAEKKEDNSGDGAFDLSNLFSEPASTEAPKKPVPKPTIQFQAAQTKIIARELELEHDFSVMKILRDKLNDSYKQLARMIVEADAMYAEFDANTKHILIDGNNRGHIFSEKEFGEKSVANFAKNGYSVYLKEYKKNEIFNMLFEYRRHGIQDLVLDETEKWVIISTDTVSDMVEENEREFIKIPVTNPELMFSMTTLSQKMQFKTDKPNRREEINALRKLMIRGFTSAKYIMPLSKDENGETHPITRQGSDGVKYVLVFTDVFEMKTVFGDKLEGVADYRVLSYRDIIREFTVQANTTVVLNYGALSFKFTDQNCDLINKVISQ